MVKKEEGGGPELAPAEYEPAIGVARRGQQPLAEPQAAGEIQGLGHAVEEAIGAGLDTPAVEAIRADVAPRVALLLEDGRR